MIKRHVAFAKAALYTVGTALAVQAGGVQAEEWKPTRNVEIVVSAGAGGGTDQLARLIQSIITKHHLLDVSTVVLNKGGGNGAEGFLDVKMDNGNPHKLIIGTNNAYLLPLVANLGYQWTELTPVAAVAEDDFILWVNTASGFESAKEYLDAVKAEPSKYRMGGSQSKDVDQTLTLLINQAEGTNFTYIPFKSGAEAAVQLAGGHIGSNVNNPAENLSQWRAGQVKPLCVFSTAPIVYTQKIVDDQSWSDVPTCSSEGLNIESYRFPRTVFMPGGVSDEQRRFYTDLLAKVTATEEFQEYLERNALAPSFIQEQELVTYIEHDIQRVEGIFTEAGWLKKK